MAIKTTHFSKTRCRDRESPGFALKTCYAIIKTRSSYGSETSISLVLDDTGLTHLSFSTPEEARAWIRMIADRKDYFRDATRALHPPNVHDSGKLMLL